MNAELARDELVAELVRIGELLINGEGREEVDAYFSPRTRPTGRTAASGATRACRAIAQPARHRRVSGTRFRGITDDVPRSRSMLHPMVVEVNPVERT
jgi:hypothetical protein